MSEQEQLPVCALCGEHPKYNGRMVGCSRPSCDVRGALMEPEAWRRLMARPRLAPHLSRELRNLLRGATGGAVTLYPLEFDAIRAALAALGEE